MKKLIYSLTALLIASTLFSCSGEAETSDNESTTTSEEEVIIDPCPSENSLFVNFNAKSQGSDTTLYSNGGGFEVAKTNIVYFHDSTMVLKIDNYEGSRKTPEDIELYLSLYTKNGEVLGEGDYVQDMSQSRSTNLLIYIGETGMLVCPVHLGEGSVTVTSYAKEKVCGSMDISLNDVSGKYGDLSVSGDFIVEKQ